MLRLIMNKSKFSIFLQPTTTMKPIVSNRKSNSNNSLKLWCAKWDRSIAGFTAVIVFALLLALVIYSIFQNVSVPSDDQYIDTPKLVISRSIKMARTLNCGTCQFSEMHCENVGNDLNNLINDINASINGNTETCTTLKLSGVIFPGDKISYGWLKGVPSRFTKVQIDQSPFVDMESDAFRGEPFMKVAHLKFSQSLGILKKDSFAGLQLIDLELDFTEVPLVEFEENSLQQLGGTLKSLGITGGIKSVDMLKNVTGIKGGKLSSLKTLFLNNNGLSGRITEELFSNVKNVEILFLSDNNFIFIDADSFSNMNNLKQLYLCNNKLRYLPPGVFDSVTGSNVIRIEGNYFDCNCDLQWFRDFYNARKSLFGDAFNCYHNGKNVDYKLVDFCDNDTENRTTIPTTTKTTSSSTTRSTSTSTSPTTNSGSTTTDKEQEDLIEIECREFRSRKKIKGAVKKVQLHNNLITMKFIQDDGTANYELKVEENNSGIDVKDFYVFVMNSQDKSDSNCSIDAGESFLQLQYGETYTVCLISNNISIYPASPYDCTSLHVPLDWAHSTWLPHKDMFVILSCVGCVFLLAIFFSSLIMFYCIRQHPNLIKGNKRVIVVESRAADVIVMPRDYRNLRHQGLSPNSFNDGYLTPKLYEKILPRTPRSGLRTISEQTSYRSMPYYAYNNQNGPSQVRRRMRLENLARFGDEELYEIPPPLPPNHPSMDNFMTSYYSEV